MSKAVLKASVFLLVSNLSFGRAGYPYGVEQAESNLTGPMRDSVRLATDIYRPTQFGAPVERPSSFLQDDRGRYASEGELTKNIGEGFDTIAFLGSLPCSNGDLGMCGTPSFRSFH
jgi:predicted acyl esterase